MSKIEISMLGDYQILNAGLAITTLLTLREKKIIDITNKQIRQGIKITKWKGRLDVISKNPTFLIDGAHNLQGITLLVNALKMFSYKRLILGISVLQDKDYSHMIDMLVPLASEVIVTETNMPRKLDANLLGQEVRRLTDNVHIEKTIEGALLKSMELANKDDMIVFAGSLYMIGEVRTKATNLLFKQ